MIPLNFHLPSKRITSISAFVQKSAFLLLHVGIGHSVIKSLGHHKMVMICNNMTFSYFVEYTCTSGFDWKA